MMKILIADDDEIYLRKLKSELDHPKWKLTFCTDPETACHYAKTMQPDLILLDNHFPEKKGIDTIPILQEYSPKSKIVLISSLFTLKEIGQIIINQADYYIPKPELTKKLVGGILNAFESSEKKDISFWNFIKKLKHNWNQDKISNIAILEDDEIFSYELKNYFKNKFPQKNITTFENQKSFFKTYSKTKPDIIFLDYYLSDGNGTEVVDKINTLDWDTKIIIISSQRKTEIASKLYDKGIIGYIVKDYEWKEYLEKYISILSF